MVLKRRCEVLCGSCSRKGAVGEDLRFVMALEGC